MVARNRPINWRNSNLLPGKRSSSRSNSSMAMRTRRPFGSRSSISSHAAAASMGGLAREPRRLFQSVPLQRELDQPVDQLRKWQPAMFPHFRIHADRREAWNCIDLVDVDAAGRFFQQKVHARHSLALHGPVTLYG